MTNEQAIRALVDVARQWAETGADGFSAYGQGYCGAMANALSTLGKCPTGAAAIRGEPDAATIRAKAQNRPKSSRGIGQASRGRKTRGDGRVTGATIYRANKRERAKGDA
jgi:hypothetical protein